MPRQIKGEGRGFLPLFIMIAGDHDKQRCYKSKPSKTLSVFDGFDFLFARLQLFYQMHSIQRATKEELYRTAEVITPLLLLRIMVL